MARIISRITGPIIWAPLAWGCALHHAPLGTAGRPDPGVGPTHEDMAFFERLGHIGEDVGDLSDPAVVEEVRLATLGLSQSARAAMTVPAMQAGVYLGQPHLVQLSCDLEKDVRDGALRGAFDLREVRATCDLLSKPAEGGDACPNAAVHMRSAWRDLLQGNYSEGRAEARQGATAMKHCQFAGITRSPVPPESDGFVMVVILQGLSAPEVSFLGHEASFNLSSALQSNWQRAIGLYGEPRGA